MALTFPGLSLPGTHDNAQIDRPEPKGVRTHYVGLNGETEIRCGRGGRYIRYPVCLHDASFTTAAKVVQTLKAYDEAANQLHGALRESGNVSRIFKNCTFEGFETDHRIIPDYAGTLESGVTYFCFGVFVFYQLTTQDD